MMTLNTEKAKSNQEPSKRDMDAMSRLLLLGFYHHYVLVHHEYKFLGGIKPYTKIPLLTVGFTLPKHKRNFYGP